MRELSQKSKSKFKKFNQDQLNDAFVKACKHNNIHIVHYLLTSPELKLHANIDVFNNLGFRSACAYGHLEVIRYLLTSQDLTTHADIHADDDMGFRYACAYNHLPVIEYLLTSPELTDHANIHANDDNGFIDACSGGHLNVVQYLLTSKKLKDHSNIHAEGNQGFVFACENGRLHIIEYLLLFNGDRYIHFEKTNYNLDWAMSEKHHDIVKAMIISLYKNDMMGYLENIPKVKEYCLDNGLNLQEWLTEKHRDDVVVNPKEEALFV